MQKPDMEKLNRDLGDLLFGRRNNKNIPALMILRSGVTFEGQFESLATNLSPLLHTKARQEERPRQSLLLGKLLWYGWNGGLERRNWACADIK